MGVIITVTTVCRTGTTHDARQAPASPFVSRRSPIRLFRLLTSVMKFLYPAFMKLSARGSGFISLRFKTVQYPLRIATTGVNMQGWSHPTETYHPGAGLKHLC